MRLLPSSCLAALLALCPSMLLGCGDYSADGGEFLEPPPEQDPPTGPTDPPATGSKWQGIEVENECGRVKLAYVLIDEVCGGTEDPNYMEYFHAPIMRDGAAIGDRLYSVDATHLWVLDTTDADQVERTALLAGFGQPMSVATYDGQLLIAAGSSGLLLVDVSEPDAPARAASLPLAGPALDVFVDGTQAFVAMGAAGVAVVELASPEAALVLDSTLTVPGFAAAVAARAGVAYVAACDTVATIDVASGALLGQNWLEDPYDDHDILVAPAKDIMLEGSTAFVAAGRYGAVALDVTDPENPALIGNCTLPDDPMFYASGVRGVNGKMFIAGGEYGILPVDVAEPSLSCTSHLIPTLPPPPEEENGECTQAPPWEILPWTDTWVPPPVPPEGRDPLQTFPTADRIYAFGDATRIGLRAIDIRNPHDLDEKFGRYSEPRLTEGIASSGNLVLVAGKAGALFRADPASGELTLQADIPEAKLTRAPAFLGDGRWVLGGLNPETAGGVVYVEGSAPYYFDTPIWSGGLAAKAATFYVPTPDRVLAVDTQGSQTAFLTGFTAHLPQALCVGGDHLVVASPEWTKSVRVDGFGAAPLEALANFGEADMVNVSRWRKALPRRVLLTGASGIVEVASLGGDASVTLHSDTGNFSLSLPPGEYLAGAMTQDHVYAVAVDRGRYRTQLVSVDLSTGAPVVEDVIAFAGSATGASALGDFLYIADGDRGIRVFDVSNGEPVPTQILELGQPSQPQGETP